MTQTIKTPGVLKPKGFATLLIIVGIVGLIASTVLTLDKIHVLKDPDYNPACNINPIFSCGSVMASPQAEIFGAPNTIVGLAGFPVLITIGVAMLYGATFKKRFWQLLQAGLTIGFIGVIYLFYQGVYRINALCLYCMAVWIVMLLAIWYVKLWNIQNGYITLPKSLNKSADFVLRHHLDILLAIYLIMAALIIQHFWYYFRTLV